MAGLEVVGRISLAQSKDGQRSVMKKSRDLLVGRLECGLEGLMITSRVLGL